MRTQPWPLGSSGTLDSISKEEEEEATPTGATMQSSSHSGTTLNETYIAGYTNLDMYINVYLVFRQLPLNHGWVLLGLNYLSRANKVPGLILGLTSDFSGNLCHTIILHKNKNKTTN